MKTLESINRLIFLAGVLVLTLAGQASAQTLTVFHTFTNNPDGSDPRAGLLLSSNIFYGTTGQGGTLGGGTVFRINMDGTSLTNLHNFSIPVYNNGTVNTAAYTNGDGAAPSVVLTLSSNTLYGTSFFGGPFGSGLIFSLNTDGTGFTNLHSFTKTINSGMAYTNGDGASPSASLTLVGNTLFGTGLQGGSSGSGVIFAINTDGTGFTNLYNFAGPGQKDGGDPQGTLVPAGNTLYGTAAVGGIWGEGTVFRINTDGTHYTNLYSLNGTSEGEFPGNLIISGNTLYGTAATGSFSGENGTVFSFNVTNLVFKTLHTFTGSSDGANPQGGLVLAGPTLYGTTQAGGSANEGMIFSINTDDTDYTNLHTFSATAGTRHTNSDGTASFASLVYSGHALYGTASAGGATSNGVLFKLSLPVASPQLTIMAAGSNVLLTWPTNDITFDLEFATNMISPMGWNTNATVPSIISGQNVVTNPVAGGQRYYRLSEAAP